MMAKNTYSISYYLILLLLISSSTLIAQEDWKYISPIPESKLINPENTIAFRHGDRLNANCLTQDAISVNGSVSGVISGNLILSTDSHTLIFQPANRYHFNETITVTLKSGIKTVSGVSLDALSFRFTVRPDNADILANNFSWDEYEKDDSEIKSFSRNLEDVVYNYDMLIKYGEGELPANFPPIDIMAYNNPAPQLAFFAPEVDADTYGNYAVISDNYGTPVFYREWPDKTVNFQKVANNQLVHKNSVDNPADGNSFAVLDDKYNIIDTLQVGNGYTTNTHDMVMLDNGNHYLMIYDQQLVGMDTVVPGGNPNATVRGFVIQELDPDHNVIFQWRSSDHFDIRDANHVDLTANTIDYVHINSFDTTADGNILLCCRHFDEITKIDRNTGEIIWRFGPKAQKNMFTFTNDTMGFTWPHDINQLENGNLTLYDNGNYHVPNFSRGMEYEIDEENLTATLVWEYSNDPIIYGKNKGSTRRLNNNSTLVGWGNSIPIIATEAAFDGTKTWELSVDSSLSYRVFKFDWKTSYFETNFDTIDFGYYDDYVSWPVIFTVTNNADQEISITSANHHLSAYSLGTQLPLTIPAGGTGNMLIYFFPEGMGQQEFNDVLTINYDAFYADTLHQRISRQVFLMATTIDPSVINSTADNQVHIQPNPTNGTIQLIANDQMMGEIIVFNTLGAKVMVDHVDYSKTHALDLASLKNGVYFIQVNMVKSTLPKMIKVVKN